MSHAPCSGRPVSSAETVPVELLELRERVQAQPSEVRAALEPLVEEVLEHAKFRHRVLTVARDAVELAAGVDRVELALGVDHEHGRDGVDPPGAGELALPALALVVLGPGDVVFFDVLLERVEAAVFLRLVEADADELDALVLVLG